MAGYNVFLRIACPKPSRDELAFLGPLRATADYSAKWLRVTLDVEAADIVEALARARELVLGGPGGIVGDVEVATVTATDGVLVRPGRLFRRKRN